MCNKDQKLQLATEEKWIFNQPWKQEMTGAQIEATLDHLQSLICFVSPHDHCIPFLESSDIATVWKHLHMTRHNYCGSGTMFNYICFEYMDAELHTTNNFKNLRSTHLPFTIVSTATENLHRN